MECIHGLMVESCDVCSPKTPPARPRTARVRPTPRRTVRENRSPATKPAVVNTGARRIFHLTHLRNLPGILAAGSILADTAGATPVVDLSSPQNRERRREAMASGSPVAGFVPFFLTPEAVLWGRMRAQELDSRLAEGVDRFPASEFALLVSSLRQTGDGALIAEGDAAETGTRFRPAEASAGRMPRDAGIGGISEPELALAELLVPGEFPFSAVALVGVANERVRSEVRALLAPAGFGQKISVYPPWFERV